MSLHLDYYPTESSGHNSEYNAWFRKRPDLIKKFFTAENGLNSGKYAYILNRYLGREDTWKQTIKDWLAKDEVEIKRGKEYAAKIFNAYFGDNALYEFNGNVRNFNLIDNLPYGACVEVPVLASKAGLRPMHIGPLPDHIALYINISSRIEELAVQGCIEGDPRKILQAILFDPLTSAVCSMSEIKSMVDEMFQASKELLPQFTKYN
jgi:alpha-galactosidase